jgi:hypothetical protein
MLWRSRPEDEAHHYKPEYTTTCEFRIEPKRT